jgi:hypothetical protein
MLAVVIENIVLQSSFVSGFSFFNGSMDPNFELNWLFYKKRIAIFWTSNSLVHHFLISWGGPLIPRYAKKLSHMINGRADHGHFILSLQCCSSPSIMVLRILPIPCSRYFHRQPPLASYFTSA